MISGRILTFLTIVTVMASLSGCSVLQENSKHAFNDGIYQTKRFSHNKVYVLNIDDDTIAVFPVIKYKDSTAIITSQRVNYTGNQKKLKDHKAIHNFYRPSFDLDVMTMPLEYRPRTTLLPNQLTTNFNGALYGGYRIDAYRVKYKRTPLNTYKQEVTHIGYSAGLFAGVGSTLIDQYSLTNHYDTQYEGTLFITGIAANVAVEKITVGISFGTDYLLDQNKSLWIYEERPCIGFTVGLNLN